jgi:hypothetical protein
METAISIGAAALDAIGALILVVNIALVLRRRPAKHISGIPVLGGVLFAIGLALDDASRAFAWVPIVVDPCGLLPLGYALIVNFRTPKR